MKGTIFSLSTKDSQVVDDVHSPVVRTLGLADHSEDITVGTIVAKNGSAAIVAYDPAAEAPVNVPVGVLARTVLVDDEAGNVIVHGCVFAETLLVGGEVATDTDMAALEANTAIFVTRS